MALFSAARSTRAPIPEVGRRTSRGGVAQLGVSRRGCGFVVCASRSLRGAKRHRTAALFRVSVASHLPARVAIVGLICAMASAALPASDRRNSTSVISCLARGGCWVVIKKKSEVFASLRKRVRSFFNSAFWNQILHPPDGPRTSSPMKTAHLENCEIGSTRGGPEAPKLHPGVVPLHPRPCARWPLARDPRVLVGWPLPLRFCLCV